MTLPGYALLTLLATGPQPIPSDTTFTLPITVVDDAPAIDGFIDPDEWRGGAVATDFIQLEPRQSDPATERTEVLIMQDERAI